MRVFQRLVGKGNEDLLLWWSAPHMSIGLLLGLKLVELLEKKMCVTVGGLWSFKSPSQFLFLCLLPVDKMQTFTYYSPPPHAFLPAAMLLTMILTG